MSMTEFAQANAEQPTTRQAIEAKNRSLPGRVTGKLKRAIDAMVWDGSRRDEAAAAAGMAVHGLREAFRKPHVKAYYREQLEVLRSSERSRNIHRLTEIRDAANNMPAVQAIRMLEQLGDDNPSTINGLPRTGGLTVVVVQASSADRPSGHVQVIENVEPNNSPQMVRDDDAG